MKFKSILILHNQHNKIHGYLKNPDQLVVRDFQN